jgi:hypothetical protein
VLAGEIAGDFGRLIQVSKLFRRAQIGDGRIAHGLAELLTFRQFAVIFGLSAKQGANSPLALMPSA